MPDYLVPLGRTFGFSANGVVSNLACSPTGWCSCAASSRAGALRRRPRSRADRPVHRPGRLLLAAAPPSSAPSTPTRPTPSRTTSATSPGRAASSTSSTRGSPSPRPPPGPAGAGSAASTGSSPTASTSPPPPSEPKPGSDELRVLFVGRAEERKGLPVLLRAFEALVEHVPARLTVIGADDEASPATCPTPRSPVASTRSAVSPTRSCGAACTTPTSSARRRSPVRASGWS